LARLFWLGKKPANRPAQVIQGCGGDHPAAMPDMQYRMSAKKAGIIQTLIYRKDRLSG